tara:strand:+ start:474 stop:764 length:291 start_codon:yes stop_codon:yes gene_type:complete
MSFIVSSSFKTSETTKVITVFKLFQLCVSKNVKQPQNQPPITPCFKLSVVSIYIDTEVESLIEKVLAAVKRLRVCLRIGKQDYTAQLAAPRGQHEI